MASCINLGLHRDTIFAMATASPSGAGKGFAAMELGGMNEKRASGVSVRASRTRFFNCVVWPIGLTGGLLFFARVCEIVFRRDFTPPQKLSFLRAAVVDDFHARCRPLRARFTATRL